MFVNFGCCTGLYGFLAGAQIAADGDLNVGLRDQRALLQWVRTHIAGFGGHPDCVVIHGGSAGAGSTVSQSIANGGRNNSLCVGLAAESVFLPTQSLCSTLECKFVRVVNGTSCASSTSPSQSPSQTDLDCLCGLSASELQIADTSSPLPNATDIPSFHWGPCVDGGFLQDRPYTMFRDGRFVRVPMVFGTATLEGSIFAPGAESLRDAVAFMINNHPGLGGTSRVNRVRAQRDSKRYCCCCLCPRRVLPLDRCAVHLALDVVPPALCGLWRGHLCLRLGGSPPDGRVSLAAVRLCLPLQYAGPR